MNQNSHIRMVNNFHVLYALLFHSVYDEFDEFDEFVIIKTISLHM